MNKKKLSIGLVSSLIAVLALAACNEVTTKENAIVTFKDSAGKEVTVLTNDIYDKYRESSDGISKFYNAILESIIRHEFDSSSTTIYKKSKEKILSEAKGNVTGAQQEAEQNRKTNGTTYDEEWQKILDSHGCKDADELLEYFKYEIEKEEIEDKYFVDNKETLTKEYIGVDDQGEAVQTQGSVKSSYPFHVRHVLVKVAEGASSFYDGTISRMHGMSKQDRTTMAEAFCGEIKNHGYEPMIYGNTYSLFDMLNIDEIHEEKIWYAFYDTYLYYPYRLEIWQYSAKQSIPGIKGDVDIDIMFKFY